jgi:DNA-binding transcriptional MerR regulator
VLQFDAKAVTATATKNRPRGAARARRPALRIGELSRRVGVSPGTLRAWERRYGLPEPRRTEGGYRLYTAEDEARIRELTRLRGLGVAPAEAARLARGDPHPTSETGHGTVTAGHAAPSQAGARVAGRAAPREEGAGASAPAPLRIPVGSELLDRLAAAIDRFDEREANAVLDEAAATLPLPAFLEGLILPFLREVGARWERGDTTPAHEHFASNLIRGRLLGMGRGWGTGPGRLAMLACPTGERHDLGLVSFGLLLRERGWRIAFFGQDTPAFTFAEAADSLAPDAVIFSAVDSRRLRESAGDIAKIADKWPVYVGGAGASRRFADRAGATLLEGEPSYGAAVLDAS